MGVVSSTKELIVATVNYSGILHSPFEFYSEESYDEEQKLSKCFKRLLQQQFHNFDPKTFKWGLGKIDQKLQKQRYTPIYRPQAGVEKDRMMNQQQFRQKWRSQFEEARKKINFEVTNEQIKNAENFDTHCYKTFISYIFDQKLANAHKLHSDKYKAFMHKFFSKSFLNQNQKIKLTMAAMEKQDVDVFLFQQTTQKFHEVVKASQDFVMYQTDHSTSIIVLKKRKFKRFHDTQQILSHFPQQFAKGLHWNEDTAICFVDNFIFISVHLSSKKQKNGPQVAKMLEDVKKLQKLYPMCELIVGGDFNSFVSPELLTSLDKRFHSFPLKPDATTTMKKRTWLQPQANKADELSHDVKDHLISTIPMIKPRIVSIRGQDSKKIKYIPNHEHPCDHFVVTANVVIERD